MDVTGMCRTAQFRWFVALLRKISHFKFSENYVGNKFLKLFGRSVKRIQKNLALEWTAGKSIYLFSRELQLHVDSLTNREILLFFFFFSPFPHLSKGDIGLRVEQGLVQSIGPLLN